MTGAASAARSLVAYDARVARLVLAALVAELGGPDAMSAETMAAVRAFLAKPPPLPELLDGRTTTAEWKALFGSAESMRALAIALADELDADPPR